MNAKEVDHGYLWQILLCYDYCTRWTSLDFNQPCRPTQPGQPCM